MLVFIIAASRHQQQALISSRDQGSSIPEADLPHIFEQFYTTSRSRKQSGLGWGWRLPDALLKRMEAALQPVVNPVKGLCSPFRYL